MKIDLSDVKIGSMVFHVQAGISQVHYNEENIDFPITINESSFSLAYDGREMPGDIHPSLFHSIEECIEYFQSVKKDLDEESRSKKRYWIWSISSDLICSGEWIKRWKYYDDNGLTTNGIKNENWDDFKKIKHESEFIDV